MSRPSRKFSALFQKKFALHATEESACGNSSDEPDVAPAIGILNESEYGNSVLKTSGQSFGGRTFEVCLMWLPVAVLWKQTMLRRNFKRRCAWLLQKLLGARGLYFGCLASGLDHMALRRKKKFKGK